MLELKKLVMTNFGPVKGTKVIEYSKGMNLLRAENGKGKSNSIFAINMLLLDNYESSYENYINYDCDEFNLSLDFILNKNFYTVTLDCKKAKSTTTVRKLLDENGNELANGEECKKYLAQLLDPVISKYALTAKQKDTENIITCSDSERRELLKRVNDLDYSKQIENYLSPKIVALKSEQVNIDKEVYALENKEYTQMVVPNLPISKEEYDNNKKELEHLQFIITQNKTLNDNLLLLRNSLISLDRDITDLEAQKTKIISRDFEADKENLKKDYDRKLSELLSLKEEKLNNHRELIQKNKDLVESYTKEVSSIKVLKLVPFDDKKLSECEQNIAIIGCKINTCKDNLNSLSSGVCPTCGSNCTHKVENFKEELEKLNKDYSNLQSERDKLIELRKSYEDKKTQNETNKAEKLRLTNQIEVFTTKIESENNLMISTEQIFNNKIADLQKNYELSLENLDKEKKDLSITLDELNRKYEDKKYSRQEINSQITNLENSLNKTQSVDDNKLKDIKSTIELYENTSIQIDSAIKFNKELEEKKKQDELELKSLRTKLEKNKADLYDCESAKNIMLKDFPNYVIDTSIQELEDSMNYFIEKVYYKSLDVSLKSNKTSIKLEYGKGKRKLPSTRLSGAESKIVQLSFINNFNKMLGLKCLILDEPDSAMDENRRLEFYQTLLSMNDIYNQIIVVTHSEPMKNFLIANTETNIIEL